MDMEIPDFASKQIEIKFPIKINYILKYSQEFYLQVFLTIEKCIK